MALVFFHHNREVNRYLCSNPGLVSRTNYFRILALASLDILFTLPMGIANTVFFILEIAEKDYAVRFYPGWAATHADWTPVSICYADMKRAPPANLAQMYFSFWANVVLAFVIFGLFGATDEARVTYRTAFCTVGRLVGREPNRKREPTIASDPTLDSLIKFSTRLEDRTLEVELGCVPIHA